MHVADALLSPVVGGAFWAISVSLIGYSAKKVSLEVDGSKTPLMGVLGAFIFAAQMINFTIPGTGSSGHLSGGLLLTLLLGPYRAFISLASVLVIQSLFFADGGILALGCNIFNLAFLPAFVAFPCIYQVITGNSSSSGKRTAGTMTAAMACLVMGAFCVVLETTLSGITELPFSTFLLFMLPIHLAIGIVEGLVTLAIVSFVMKTEPALLARQSASSKPRFTLALFTLAAMIGGGVLSLFASPLPDGLEWSIAKVSQQEKLYSRSDNVHDILASLQDRTAFLPDYSFKISGNAVEKTAISASPVNPGTSVSGIVGSLSMLLLAGAAGFVLKKRAPKREKKIANSQVR
ncbi:MAG: cobalamin biosynthesis protein CbiM [Chlorobium sp.]|nr:MAG: cobalamin biosynthesis protein CbiM [Chlorobium sp.]